jgi:hypothetical protein
MNAVTLTSVTQKHWMNGISCKVGSGQVWKRKKRIGGSPGEPLGRGNVPVQKLTWWCWLFFNRFRQDSSLYDFVTLYRGWIQPSVHECRFLLNGCHSWKRVFMVAMSYLINTVWVNQWRTLGWKVFICIYSTNKSKFERVAHRLHNAIFSVNACYPTQSID